MSRRTQLFIAVFSVATLAVPLRALEWKQTQISAKPERGDDAVRARFEFKNTSKNAVHILGVTTSCGCTEASPSASEIKPGETGALDVLFTIGKRTGLQEKEITVMTDESTVPVKLALRIKLPEAAPVAPATH